MREFNKILPGTWRDKGFRGLPSSDAKLLYFYVCTNQHQNAGGCYRLPDAYGADDLGWEIGRFGEARELLISSGLIHFDGETSELYVTGWFQTNPTMNDKHAKGAETCLYRLDSDSLREVVEGELLEWEDQRAKALEAKQRNMASLPRIGVR